MFGSNTEIRYTLIVAAGGSGKRMGLNYPKQFISYKGRPVFVHVLEKAQHSDFITDIIVTAPKEYIQEIIYLCDKFRITKAQGKVILGGAERQDSVYNALKLCSRNSVIAVHDGAKPFLKDEYIEGTFNELMNNNKIDGLVTGVPVKDTIKIVDENGIIISTPARKGLAAAQTPQVFRGEILIDAYEKAKEEGFMGTDDSSLVERYGGKVKIFQGDYGNIKITTKEDLNFLEQEDKI